MWTVDTEAETHYWDFEIPFSMYSAFHSHNECKKNDVGVLSIDLFNLNGSFKSVNIANNSPGDFLQIADNLIWDILKLLLCWEDA